MEKNKRIEELKAITVVTPIEGTYMITKCEYKPFKQKPGKFFLQCELADRTGSLKGIVWNNAETLKEWLRNKMVVEITGDLDRYNDNPQIVVKTLKETRTFNVEDFLASLPAERINELSGLTNELIKTIHDPICSALCSTFMAIHGEKFITCPAGVGAVHHNYLGGLLEHTYSLMKVADHYCSTVKGLDRDVLLTGALFHDMGKIKGYHWDTVIEMSDDGRLLHHIPLGFEMLNELCKGLYPFANPIESNCPTVLKLKHMICSHHDIEGTVKPMTPEALALSAIDGMDAIVNHCVNYMAEKDKQKEDENWTAYCNLTQRMYYQPKEKTPVTPPEVKPAAREEVDIDSILGN